MSQPNAQVANLYRLLKRPIITEKAVSLSAFNQYVFEVDPDANKIELAKAFELAFPGRKVKSIRTVKSPGKLKRRGKSVGRTADEKRAIFSIEGEPLELVMGG
jgi:large subunit ribosomal protein L23